MSARVRIRLLYIALYCIVFLAGMVGMIMVGSPELMLFCALPGVAVLLYLINQYGLEKRAEQKYHGRS